MSQILRELGVKFLWCHSLIEAGPEMTQKGMNAGVVQEIELCKWPTLIEGVDDNSSNENLLVGNGPAPFETLHNHSCCIQVFVISQMPVLHQEKAKCE
jgi:hypothetical protein